MVPLATPGPFHLEATVRVLQRRPVNALDSWESGCHLRVLRLSRGLALCAVQNLGTIDDCDGSGLSVSGVLAGNDVDWYEYDGTDGFSCLVTPTRNITADGQVRLCKYLECNSGTTSVTCPGGTQADTSPQGHPGCCGAPVVAPELECIGTGDESAKVYFRIDKPSAFDCVSYTVNFNY